MQTTVTSQKTLRRLVISMSLALVVVLLAGCGKKGDPEPPDGDSDFPNIYPSQ